MGKAAGERSDGSGNERKKGREVAERLAVVEGRVPTPLGKIEPALPPRLGFGDLGVFGDGQDRVGPPELGVAEPEKGEKDDECACIFGAA